MNNAFPDSIKNTFYARNLCSRMVVSMNPNNNIDNNKDISLDKNYCCLGQYDIYMNIPLQFLSTLKNTFAFGIKVKGTEDGYAGLELGSGVFHFEVQK